MDLLRRLDELRANRDEEGREDGYVFRPSDYAYERAQQYLALFADHPSPHIVLDGEAGIVFAWEKRLPTRTARVRAAFRGDASASDYVYYQEGSHSTAKYDAIDLTHDSLKDRLDWLATQA